MPVAVRQLLEAVGASLVTALAKAILGSHDPKRAIMRATAAAASEVTAELAIKHGLEARRSRR